MEYSMQKGGYHTKSEALKAKEFTIAELHAQKFIPFEYTVKEFFDFWLYYHMIDEMCIRDRGCDTNAL